VVAGTASAVAGGVRHRQDQKYASREQDAYNQQQDAYDQGAADAAAQQPPPPAPTAPAGGGDDTMAELEKLADMKSRGLLTDDEFAAAKAKILAG
jgi:protein involved in polysaccharide export with SLBB domain